MSQALSVGYVTAQIALKIEHADMNQHVHLAKRHQLPDNREWQSFKFVGIKEREVQSPRI